ncbi:MAG: hypothetical protein IJH12_03345 [Clostridia bacterium]|nr:hypothetical protein [Clostridia bacterium]
MKAKKVLLFIIIVLLLLIGALVIVYFKTDIFKTNTQKFWKYVNKNAEIIEAFNNEDMQSIRNKRSNNPYEINSSMNVRKGIDSYIFTANTRAENANNIITNFDFQHNDRDIINFTLVKKSNLIAAKLDDLANGYIAIKNNDIQELAKDAGIEDVTNIPDNINWFSILDFLYMQSSDEKYFVDTYSKLIEQNTSKENYSVEESGLKIDDNIHAVTGYKIKLTEDETKDIAKKILTHMKDEDARAINFISSRLKLLNAPKKYTEYENICEQISKLIEKIDSIETSDDVFLEITTYVENSETVQTNIKVKDGNVIKIIFKKDENKMCIIQENPNKILEKSENGIIKYLANIQEITLSNEISGDKKISTIKLDAKFYNNLVVEYNSRIAILDSAEKNTEFEDTPKMILNELELDNLKQKYKLIIYGLTQIYNNKKNMLNNNQEDVNVAESDNQNVENTTDSESEDTTQDN